MAARQLFPNAGGAFVKVEVDWTSNWNAASPSYTDVTDDVRFPISWERGRNDEYQTISPGRLDFVLNNRARSYDPTTNANMVPARPARLTCYYPTTGTAYQQIDASLEDMDVVWDANYDSWVNCTAIERYGALSYCQMIGYGSIALTSQGRLADLAGVAGWGGATSFASGSWAILSEVYTNTDVLSAMQECVDGQVQILYETRDGTLKSLGAFAASSSSIGTFGDNLANIQAGTELPYYQFTAGIGGGYLYTNGHFHFPAPQPPQDVVKAVGSPYTVTKYGTRTYARNISTTSIANATSAITSWASSEAAQASYRVKEIVIRPLASPSTLFPVVLNADLNNTVTIKQTPPGGGGARNTFTAKIRSIRHEISESDWTVTWELSP